MIPFLLNNPNKTKQMGNFKNESVQTQNEQKVNIVNNEKSVGNTIKTLSKEMNTYSFNKKINEELIESDGFSLLESSLFNGRFYFNQTSDIDEDDFNNLSKEQIIELSDSCYELKNDSEMFLDRLNERLEELEDEEEKEEDEGIDFEVNGSVAVRISIDYHLENESESEVTYVYSHNGGIDFETVSFDKDDLMEKLNEGETLESIIEEEIECNF